MRRLNKVFTVCFLLGTAAASTGCVDESPTVFVRQMVVPEEETCIFEPDPSGLFISEGVYDYGIRDDLGLVANGYFGEMLVGNQMVHRGDEARFIVETNRVQFFELEIEVFDEGGNSLGAYTDPTTGFADPANGTDPSYGLVGGLLVDGPIIDVLRGTAFTNVVSRVIVRGISLGGEEVETGVWDYPITVCDHCLGCIEPLSCDDDLITTCIVGQDFSPDCRTIGVSRCN